MRNKRDNNYSILSIPAEESENLLLRSAYLDPVEGWKVLDFNQTRNLLNRLKPIPSLAGLRVHSIALILERVPTAPHEFVIPVVSDEVLYFDGRGMAMPQDNPAIEELNRLRPQPSLNLSDADKRSIVRQLHQSGIGSIDPEDSLLETPPEESEEDDEAELPASDHHVLDQVARFVSDRLRNCGKTQTRVAELCGFARPHMISMIKTGKSRLPINKIRPLARALGADHLELFQIFVKEYHPELASFIDELTVGRRAERTRPPTSGAS